MTIDGIIYSWYGSGGIGTYFKELTNSLVRPGVDVQFLSYSNSISLPNSIKMRIRPFERFRDCVVPTGSGGVFHSSYYRLPTCASYRVVTTVHDFISERTRRGPWKYLHSLQKFRAIMGSHALICVSHATAADLIEYCPNVDRDRIHVIHNAASGDFYPIVAVSEPAHAVLYVGERKGYKNFRAAVLACALIPRLQLRIVGGGDASLDELSLLAKYLPGRHSFLGRLSMSQLNVEYNDALCLLYPSSMEGFGIPLVEAMRAGCPVVAVRSAATAEVVAEAGYLADSCDPEELSVLVRGLFDDTVRSRVRVAGLTRARDFSWEEAANQILAVYRDVWR